ncbi:hypothetical protein LSAT2_008875 [Lamellibrachia satsuma]|nr:hypothetical protein LSAT2_008875 [Lamellibrachia satsuma]
MLFGVVLSVVAVAQSTGTIGANPLTCINFDLRRWDGKFKASRGVYVNIKDVSTVPNGVANKCGDFVSKSRVNIPLFHSNSFFKFSASLWFKKIASSPGACMTILSTDRCGDSSIYISSNSETLLTVKLTTGTQDYNYNTATPSQASGFVHVVVTFSASTSTLIGRMRVYINGNLIQELPTQGKIKPLLGPMVLGSDSCGGDSDFIGQMDSVSFARAELSASDVTNLYSQRGCIGDPLVQVWSTVNLVVRRHHDHHNQQHHSVDDQQHYPVDDQQHHSVDDQQHHSVDDQQHYPVDDQQHHSVDDHQHYPVDDQQHHPVDDQQHHSVEDQQHHSVDDQQHHPVDDQQHHSVDDQQHYPVDDHKHYSVDDQQHYPVNDHKHYPVDDQQHYPVNDHKHYPVDDQQHYPVNDHKHHSVDDQQHYPVDDHKHYPVDDHKHYPVDDHNHYPVDDHKHHPVDDQQHHPVDDQQHYNHDQEPHQHQFGYVEYMCTN